MQPRTEELLYFLLWTADTLMRPTWRNLNDSFEEWAWRNRLTRRLAELERAQLIERHPEPDLGRVVRLTKAGRRLALGGRDPVEQWSRPWDSHWRMILFDLPVARTDVRQKLLRLLHRTHCGFLQNSVWITPDTTSLFIGQLGGAMVEPDAFLIMEGRPAAGETDQEIVASAWNFREINRRYERYLRTVEKLPADASRSPEWLRTENDSWKASIGIDPLLPASLLPAGYRGCEAWSARKALVLRLAAESNLG